MALVKSLIRNKTPVILSGAPASKTIPTNSSNDSPILSSSKASLIESLETSDQSPSLQRIKVSPVFTFSFTKSMWRKGDEPPDRVN